MPILLPVPSANGYPDAVSTLLDMLNRHCTAKEVIIAAEEGLERVRRGVVTGVDDTSDEDTENDDGNTERNETTAPLSLQLVRLVRLFQGEFQLHLSL